MCHTPLLTQHPAVWSQALAMHWHYAILLLLLCLSVSRVPRLCGGSLVALLRVLQLITDAPTRRRTCLWREPRCAAALFSAFSCAKRRPPPSSGRVAAPLVLLLFLATARPASTAEVAGCSPGSWVNVSGFVSPAALNGVYAPYIYNNASSAGLGWTLPYSRWPPYNGTGWPSGLTCNMNSHFGSSFPDGFYNVNNGGQNSSSQFFITLSANGNYYLGTYYADYGYGSYWGIHTGAATCGTGNSKITSNLFVYNYCGGAPCGAANTAADPFTASTVTATVNSLTFTNNLGIISSGSGVSGGGALWSKYAGLVLTILPFTTTASTGSWTNSDTPAGIVVSCISPLTCSSGQYVANTVTGSFLSSYSCTNCSAGTYQSAALNSNGAWSCIPCASGYSTNGLSGQSVCVPCLYGTNGTSGQANCSAATGLARFALDVAGNSTALASWTGTNPCNGTSTSNWTGVTCSGSLPVALALSGLGLTGSVSCAASGNTSVTYIDLVRAHASTPSACSY